MPDSKPYEQGEEHANGRVARLVSESTTSDILTERADNMLFIDEQSMNFEETSDGTMGDDLSLALFLQDVNVDSSSDEYSSATNSGIH